MKRLVCSLVMVVIFYSRGYAGQPQWENVSGEYRHVNTLCTIADHPETIFIGTNNAVVKSTDAGGSWRPVLLVPGGNKRVNQLSSDERGNCLYAATGNGLYLSRDQGNHWARLFKGKNYFENDCTRVLYASGRLYLGTSRGAFVSLDQGKSWVKLSTEEPPAEIKAVVDDPIDQRVLYLASAREVFRSSDAGQHWSKVFSAVGEEASAEEEPREEEDGEALVAAIRSFALCGGGLYVAVKNRLYVSRDKGTTWESADLFGLFDLPVEHLAVSSSGILYAATGRSVFQATPEGRWQEISQGLYNASRIKYLVADGARHIYAACENGLFSTRSVSLSEERHSSVDVPASLIRSHIQELHQAAIAYAEVRPDKIALWRKQAARRGWLPKLSVGANRDVADLWHWESGSSTKQNDDQLLRGKDSVEWQVSLSWDLGELVWNNDQTSIDVRSRLMVELREDILEQVTKLYFERLRLQREIGSLSIEDAKRRADKELKVEEVSASIDALTGGYFSRMLEKEGPAAHKITCKGP